MAELLLRVTSDSPLAVPDDLPEAPGSKELAAGIRVSQPLLLSEAMVYAFAVAVASGVAANVATEAVKTVIRRLREKNPSVRFELEQEEITLDDDGLIRRIVATKISEKPR